MPYQRRAQIVLEEWHKLERDLTLVEANSVEAAVFRNAAEVLQDEYQHLVDEAIIHERSEPPLFPEI